MSFVKVCQLAEQFIEKIAAHHYENEAPEDKKAEDIKWITEEERKLIKENGTDPAFKPHNPPSSVKSEKDWDRAKKVTKKYWKNYKEPWAVVYSVYKNIYDAHHKKK